MPVVEAACGKCQTPFIHLVWLNGKRILIVECPDCGQENHYSLDALLEALGSNDPILSMLENFQPKGLPS